MNGYFMKALSFSQTLNGRIVFVDYAKPQLGEKLGMPIARGPPEPKVDDN